MGMQECFDLDGYVVMASRIPRTIGECVPEGRWYKDGNRTLGDVSIVIHRRDRNRRVDSAA
jgi:hypothetical protein